MERKHTTRAFTLIEMLVSVSIVGILSLLIVQSFFTSLRSNSKTELMKDMKQNGDYAMQTMTRIIQNSDSVVTCSPNSLVTRGFDAKLTTLAAFDDGSGVCRIASSSSVTQYTLTSSNVTVDTHGFGCDTAINFTCENVGGSIAKVNISFDLVQKGAPADAIDKASQIFSSSVVVRNRQL
jgi:prepilin-type N-terminal cleavage/methylation domain-containing protein